MDWSLWTTSYFAGTFLIQTYAQQNFTVSSTVSSNDYDADYPDYSNRDYPNLDYYNDDRREGRSFENENKAHNHQDFDDFTMKQLRSTIPGIPGEDYGLYQSVPDSSFDCGKQGSPGFYGDVEAHCQVFHICQENDRHDSFLCPIGTVFNQISFVCDWWFNFKCEDTPAHYYLNHRFHSRSAMASMQDTMKKMRGVQDKKLMKMRQGRRAGKGIALSTKKRDSLERNKVPTQRKVMNLFMLRMRRKRIGFLKSTEYPVDVQASTLPVERQLNLFNSVNQRQSSEENVLTSTLPFEGRSVEDSAVKVIDSRETFNISLSEYLTTATPNASVASTSASHSSIATLPNRVDVNGTYGGNTTHPSVEFLSNLKYDGIKRKEAATNDTGALTEKQFLKLAIDYVNTTIEKTIEDSIKKRNPGVAVIDELVNPNAEGNSYGKHSEQNTSNSRENVTESLPSYYETTPPTFLPAVTQPSKNVDSTSVTSGEMLNVSRPFRHQNNFIIGNDTHISVSVTIHSNSGRSRLQWKRLPGAKRIRNFRLKNVSETSNHHTNSITEETAFKRRTYAQKPRSKVMWIPAKKNSLESRLDFRTFMQPQSYDAIAEIKLMPIDHSLQKSVLETNELPPINITDISKVMTSENDQRSMYPADIHEQNSQYLLGIDHYQSIKLPLINRSNIQNSKISVHINRFSDHSGTFPVTINRFNDYSGKFPVNINQYNDHSSKSPVNINTFNNQTRNDQSSSSIRNLSIASYASDFIRGLSKVNITKASANLNDTANIMLVVKPVIQRSIVRRNQNRGINAGCKAMCKKLLRSDSRDLTLDEKNETNIFNDSSSSTLFQYENLESSVRPKSNRETLLGVSPSEQWSVKYDPGPNCNESNKVPLKGWSVIIDAGLITKEKTVKRRGCVKKPNTNGGRPVEKPRPNFRSRDSNVKFGSKDSYNNRGAKLNGESMDQRYWLNLVKNWLENSPAKSSENQEPSKRVRQAKRDFPARGGINPFHIPKWDEQSSVVKHNFKRASLDSPRYSKMIEQDWSDLQTERSDWSQATQKTTDLMRRPKMYTFRDGPGNWNLDNIDEGFTNQGTLGDAPLYRSLDSDIFTSGTNSNRDSRPRKSSDQVGDFSEEDGLWPQNEKGDNSRSWSGDFVDDDLESLSRMQDWSRNVKRDYDEDLPAQRNRNADSLGWSGGKGSGAKKSNRGRSMTDEWNWSNKGFDGNVGSQRRNPDASSVARDPIKGSGGKGGRSKPDLNGRRSRNSMKSQPVDTSFGRNPRKDDWSSMKRPVSVSSKGGNSRDWPSEENSKWNDDNDPEWQMKRDVDDDWIDDAGKENVPQSDEWANDEKSDWANEQASSKPRKKDGTVGSSKDRNLWPPTMGRMNPSSNKGFSKAVQSRTAQRTPNRRDDGKNGWPGSKGDPALSGCPKTNRGNNKGGKDFNSKRTNAPPSSRRSQGSDTKSKWGSNENKRTTSPGRDSRRQKGSSGSFKGSDKNNQWNSSDRQRPSFGSSGQGESSLSSWDSSEDYDDGSSDNDWRKGMEWSWPPKSDSPKVRTKSSKGSNKGDRSPSGSSRRSPDGAPWISNKGSPLGAKGSSMRPLNTNTRTRGSSWGPAKGENVGKGSPKAAPTKGTRGAPKGMWKNSGGASRNASNKGESEMKKIVWSSRISTDGKPGNGWIPITLRPDLKRNNSTDNKGNKGWSTTDDENTSSEEDWPSYDTNEDWPSTTKGRSPAPEDNMEASFDEDWLSSSKGDEDWPSTNSGGLEDWPSPNLENATKASGLSTPNIGGALLINDWSPNDPEGTASDKDERGNIDQNSNLAQLAEKAENDTNKSDSRKDPSSPHTTDESAKLNFYIPGFRRRYKRDVKNADRPSLEDSEYPESKPLKIIKSGEIITRAFNNEGNNFFLAKADILVGENLQPESRSLTGTKSKRSQKRQSSDSLMPRIGEFAGQKRNERLAVNKDFTYLDPLPKESIVRQAWSSPFYSSNFSASGWIPVNARRWPEGRNSDRLHASDLRESIPLNTARDSKPWTDNVNTNNTVYSKLENGLQERVRKDSNELANQSSAKLALNESISASSDDSTEVKVGNETLRILAFSDIMKKLPPRKDSEDADSAKISWSIPLNAAPKMYSLKPVDQSNSTGRNVSNSWIFSNGNGTKQAWVLAENGNTKISPRLSVENSSQLSGDSFDEVPPKSIGSNTGIDELEAEETGNPKDSVNDSLEEEFRPKFDSFQDSDWKPVITAIGRVIPFTRTYPSTKSLTLK